MLKTYTSILFLLLLIISLVKSSIYEIDSGGKKLYKYESSKNFPTNGLNINKNICNFETESILNV
jgi:hypothetical protein